MKPGFLKGFDEADRGKDVRKAKLRKAVTKSV
jgi:hypothetical protein